MFRFSGFFDLNASFLSNASFYRHILSQMGKSLFLRGTDYSSLLTANCGILHKIASSNEATKSDMSVQISNNRFHAVLNGEFYNSKQLRLDLTKAGCNFYNKSDVEILLNGFLKYGTHFFNSLEGCFSACIYAEDFCEFYLLRDAFGTKPLFYCYRDGCLVFSTKIKSIFDFPGITPILDKNGCNEIFSLGPARTPGSGVFCNINEVLPGHYLHCGDFGIRSACYWHLSAYPHTDNYATTVEKTLHLVTNSVKSRMKNAKRLGTFLSGGLDSCVVSKICRDNLEDSNASLLTFSFDYEENSNFFKSNSFQPSEDSGYVKIMVDDLSSQHRILTCPQQTLVDRLSNSLNAHDLPCMADIDSSLNYFCEEAVNYCDVVLTGECADEVFGGYPWFYREDLLSSEIFPWTPTLVPRQTLLKPDFVEFLCMNDYVNQTYAKFLAKVPYLPEECAQDRLRRKIGYLSIYGFMQTLLNRMERCSTTHNLTARVPFADRLLVEYIYNVPWNMKYRDGVEKHLLRTACGPLIPQQIATRKKSPFPKTYHPLYEQLLAAKLREVLSDSHAPLHHFVDFNAVSQFLDSTKNYGAPWYGQLMAGPQMIAYLLQINQWIADYKIQIDI